MSKLLVLHSRLTILLLPPLLLLAATLYLSTGAAAAGPTVDQFNFQFTPSEITIEAGQTVTWTNSDEEEHVVADTAGDWISGPLAPGEIFTHTFPQTGSFPYYCTIHSDMKGTVIVKPVTSIPGNQRVFLPLLTRGRQSGAAAAIATRNGRWSDPATWGGVLPEPEAQVTIPPSLTVILDTSPPALRSLQISGTLTFSDTDLNLSADWIVVRGRLNVGSEQQPYLKRATITLTGNHPNDKIMGMGAKVLGVLRGGALDLHGAPVLSWTKLAATAATSATIITLAQPTGWRVGDKIVITPSDFSPFEAEERTIAAVAGASITLDRPLQYQHWGEQLLVDGQALDLRAAVGLLNRNIVVRGAPQPENPFLGGHIIIMGGAAARFDGVEVTAMGQRGIIARYPIHYHITRDGKGSYVKNTSMHHNFQRCLTVHTTNDLLIQNNVAYDTFGHCYFMEDGNERGNSFEGNLGVLTRQLPLADRVRNPNVSPEECQNLGNELQDRCDVKHDRRASVFWITNPSNSFVGNLAAGAEHGFGFWIDLIEAVDDETGERLDTNPLPLGTFRANYVCSIGALPGTNLLDKAQTAGNGLQVDGPRFVMALSAAQPGIEKLTSYKNANAGIWLDGDQAVTGALLADNRIGLINGNLVAGLATVQDSLIVGQSNNQPPAAGPLRQRFAAMNPSFPEHAPFLSSDAGEPRVGRAQLERVGITGF